MKIPSKKQPQQIAFNHSSDIGFKDLMNLYKKCTAELCSFLVIDTTLVFDNPSRFSIVHQRKNRGRILALTMTIVVDKFRD